MCWLEPVAVCVQTSDHHVHTRKPIQIYLLHTDRSKVYEPCLSLFTVAYVEVLLQTYKVTRDPSLLLRY